MEETFKDIGAELYYRITNDPNILHKNRALYERILIVCAEDGIEWALVKSALRELKIIREWEKKIIRDSRALRGVPTIGGDPTPECQVVKDVWPEAPVSKHASAPPGWGYNDPRAGAVYQVVIKDVDGETVMKKTQAAFEPAVIVGRFMHVEQKKVLLKVAWRTGKNGQWREEVFPRARVLDARGLVSTADDGMPVSSDNAALMVKYLAAYEHHNGPLIDVGYYTSSQGWKGSADDPTCHGFICGAKQIGGNGKAFSLHATGPGDKEEVTSVRSKGTFESWRDALALISHFPAVRIVTYASLASVMLPILDAPNAIVEFVGPTSTGKTRILQVAQAMWRPSSTPISSWNNTLNNFESKAHLYSGLPLYMDDTKLVVKQQGLKGEEVLGKTIYMYVNGIGRGRDTRDGGQRHTTKWRSVMISTGESPSSELAHAEGAAARVLSFWMAPFGDNSSETGALLDRLVDGDLAEHYGHAGPRFVQWLHDNREMWPMLNRTYDEVTLKIRNMFNTPASARLARVVALFEVTAMAAHGAGLIPWPAQSLLEDPAIMALLRSSIRQAEAGANDAERAWEHMVSVAESCAAQFAPWQREPDQNFAPHGGWLGWKGCPDPRKSPDSTMVGWLPSKLRKALAEDGFHADTILKVWRARGMLDAVPTSRSHPRVIQVGGEGKGSDKKRPVRMICLRLAPEDWVPEIVEASTREREPGEDDPDAVGWPEERPLIGNCNDLKDQLVLEILP